MSLPLILEGFQYLCSVRKLNEETIRTFGIGYCDPQGELYFPADYTGTLPKLDNRFYNSVVWPIIDLFGVTVGASARPLVSKPNMPKYLNTIYEKADHLYGLNISFREALKEQKLYIVEGNVDVLQTWQAGVKNVAGMLGSNFSFNQLCLATRFVKNLVFVPDPDKAGRGLLGRMQEAIDKKFYDSDLSFSYIELPECLDPDKYFLKYTKEDFKALPEKELV